MTAKSTLLFSPQKMVTNTQREIVAGSVGGIFQVLVGQPFDTVKVRLQTQSAANPMYSSVVDCVRKTMAQEGPLALYKGTLTPLLAISLCVSIQFGTLDMCKKYFGQGGKELTLSQLVFSGGMAGLANSVICGPVEHVRIKLQLQTAGNKLYSGPWDLVKRVHSEYGIRGIFKGQGITLWREAPGFGVYFGIYEYMIKKKMQQNNVPRSQISTGHQLMYGALSGYGLWLAVYPFDIIKSKIQGDSLDVTKRQFRSSWDCTKQIYQANGIKGFYRGKYYVNFRVFGVHVASWSCECCYLWSI